MRDALRALGWWATALLALAILFGPATFHWPAVAPIKTLGQGEGASQVERRRPSDKFQADDDAPGEGLAGAQAAGKGAAPLAAPRSDGAARPRPSARYRPGQPWDAAATRNVRRGPIDDDARLLDPRAAHAVLAEVVRTARTSGVQFGVWTVAGRPEEPLAELALRRAERQQLGTKGKDDGLLLAVAPAMREARLEVGYGLEHVLSDAVSARLLRQYLVVPEGGTLTGDQVVALVRAVRVVLEDAVAKGTLAPPAARRDHNGAAMPADWVPWLLVGLFLLWWLSQGRGGRGGRFGFWPGVGFGSGFGGGFGGSSSGSGDTSRGGGGSFGGGGASGRW